MTKEQLAALKRYIRAVAAAKVAEHDGSKHDGAYFGWACQDEREAERELDKAFEPLQGEP